MRSADLQFASNKDEENQRLAQQHHPLVPEEHSADLSGRREEFFHGCSFRGTYRHRLSSLR